MEICLGSDDIDAETCEKWGYLNRIFDSASLPIPTGRSTGISIRSTAPLVGREPELERLQRLFEVARSGRPQLAVVRGDAGAGKTRLVRELIERTAGSSESWVGHCVAQLNAPYAPIVMLLARALADGRHHRGARGAAGIPGRGPS